MDAAREPRAASGAPAGRGLWVMLLALTTGFALSQAYRTVAAMMATQLQQEFALSAQQLGMFAAMFHFSFGAPQLLMGIGIDLYGVRRTVLAAFPLTIAGALLSAFAPNYPLAVLGQALTGIGCAPAFLVCTVFIARRFPPARFASVSGLVLGMGGVGLLVTGTPLAWVVQAGSWRTGFLVLAGGSAAAWLVIFALVREPAPVRTAPSAPIGAALREAAALMAIPHTLGIVALAAVTYASFIALRGLWLGPMLIERFGFSLLQTGNVALAVSVTSLLGPPVFGHRDTAPASRRRRIVAFSLLLAALFALLAVLQHAASAVALTIAIGFLTGFIVWQYADVRTAYSEALTGRAMAVFTMAMFLGVAVMQWITGLVASAAQAARTDPYTAVLLAIAALLVLGALAFRTLPAPPATRR
ncbi:MFS transporter [Ramlibacter sp.]|uniref:MFS transporter n=1 Tax=Ramlibacter sp. TaxID=1917967 RepID=UPI002CF138B6|nr:MFS transporter [Ramlibacter sp.]HWI81297.1 MFS transporter [Ramlibacter sp.]